MKGYCTGNPDGENLIVNRSVYVDKADVPRGLIRDQKACVFSDGCKDDSWLVWPFGYNYNPATRDIDCLSMELVK